MKFSFHSETPEIFDSLDEAQIAIDSNPLPYSAMTYKISNHIIYKGKICKDKFAVNSIGSDGRWFGFLNTKEENL